MKEIIISVPVKTAGASIRAHQGVATKMFQKDYRGFKSLSYGYLSSAETDGQLYYQYRYAVPVVRA